MKTLLIGFAIIAVLVLATGYLTSGSSSVRFINLTDHNVFISITAGSVGEERVLGVPIRANSDTYAALKHGQYIVLYRQTGVTEDFNKDNIEITYKTIFKITEENGELVLKEKE